MSKKKKQKRKKEQNPLTLSTDEEAKRNTLLENLQDIDTANIKEQIDGPRLARAVVENLPGGDPDSMALLLAIRDAFVQKDVRKAVNKALFKIKQKGFEIPETAAVKDAPFIVKGPDHEDPIVFVGPISEVGTRPVFFAQPQIPKGFDLGLGIVNDVKGILEFVSGRYSKKRLNEIKDIFLTSIKDMVETSLDHVASILERAYGQEKSGSGKFADEYLKLRPRLLENTSPLEQPVIFECMDREVISRNSLTSSQTRKILDHSIMKSWVVEQEDIKSVMEEIQSTQESRILISADQKANRINEIKRDSIAELYPTSKRSILKNRLEEMAYMFFKRKEEDYALLALTASHSLEEEVSLLSVNPFLSELLERSLDFYSQTPGEMDKSRRVDESPPSSLILP